MSPISNILGLTIDRARSFFEVVVLLILLTWWQQLPEPESPHQVIEFYAGVGRIAALAQYTGYKSVAVDLEYGKSLGLERGSRPPMDINSNAGLMWLDVGLVIHDLFFH